MQSLASECVHPEMRDKDKMALRNHFGVPENVEAFFPEDFEDMNSIHGESLAYLL